MDSVYAKPQVVTDVADCFFYHTVDVPGFGIQEGQWDLRGGFRSYIGDVSCAGKRVLDVGCASGFLSFSAEADGAKEVVSFDMNDAHCQHLLPFHNQKYYNDHASWCIEQTERIQKWNRAYWLMHSVYQSKAKVYYGDVYDLPFSIGVFDLVIVGAVLEHLADPIRALASVCRRARDTLVINTSFLETEEKMARFEGDAGNPELNYVFWTYSLGIYRNVLRMLGFEIERLVKGEFKANFIGGGLHSRTAIVARRFA